VSISGPFIKRPVATSLLAVAFLVVGVICYFQLPVSALPQVDFPTIQVSAGLPGASPETMASNVATPLERQLSLIPGVTQLTSSSSLGSTGVILQFELSRNIDGAAQDVQAAVQAAAGQLPTNLPSPPSIRKVNPADSPVIVLAMRSDTLPISKVSDYADSIVAQQVQPQSPRCGLEPADALLIPHLSQVGDLPALLPVAGLVREGGMLVVRAGLPADAAEAVAAFATPFGYDLQPHFVDRGRVVYIARRAGVAAQRRAA